MEHLHIKRRIVCQNSDRIVMNMESVFHGLDNDRLVFVCDDPVKAGRRQLGIKRGPDKVHNGEFFFRLADGRALA